MTRNCAPGKQLAFSDCLVTLRAPDQAQGAIDYSAIFSGEVCSPDHLADGSFLSHSDLL
jgi:hypothetical protein